MLKYIGYYIAKSCKNGTLLTVSATYGGSQYRIKLINNI